MRRAHEKRRSTFDLGLYVALFAAVVVLMVVGLSPYSVFPLIAIASVAAVAAGIVLGTRALLEVMARAGNAAAEERRRRNVMLRQVHIGTAEAALALFAALLIAGEVFAIANGFGPFFAVVSLGYFMAAGSGYMVYRGIRSERASQPAPAAVAAEPAPLMEPAMARAPQTAESHAMARQADLLRRLTEEQAETVLARAQWTSVPADCRVAEAGAEGENVYIIVDGQVQLTGRSDVGEVTVRIAGPGESFPLAALLGNGTLVTSATAMTDLLAYAIPRKQLIALCEERPEIGMTIYAQVAEILTDRYRSTLARHLNGVGTAVRQQEMWANV